MSEWFSRQALGSLPADAARRWGAREALSFQGRRWTFAELSERVDRVARGLMGLGIAPGEHVALWMLNLPEFIDAAFAVMKIGAVLVPINTRFRTEDLAYVLAQSDASTLLIAERSGPVNYLGMVRQLAPSLETARAGEVREARFPRWKRVVVAAASPGRRCSTGERWSERESRSTTRTFGTARRPSTPRRRPSSCTPRARPGSPRGRCTATGSSGTWWTAPYVWRLRRR